MSRRQFAKQLNRSKCQRSVGVLPAQCKRTRHWRVLLHQLWENDILPALFLPATWVNNAFSQTKFSFQRLYIEHGWASLFLSSCSSSGAFYSDAQHLFFRTENWTEKGRKPKELITCRFKMQAMTVNAQLTLLVPCCRMKYSISTTNWPKNTSSKLNQKCTVYARYE